MKMLVQVHDTTYTPGVYTTALAVTKECVTAALEKDGASVVGATESGVATLGTGFAAGALCANWDEVDVWVLISSFVQLRF